jgi:small-conductance mechanosensitive channel
MFAYLKLLPVIAMASALAYGAHWFIVNEKDNEINRLQKMNEQTLAENVAFKFAVDKNEDTILMLEQMLSVQNSRIDSLTRANNQIEKERDQYLSIFRKHDLTKLALVKPGLIESRINNGTKQVFMDLEEISKND